MYYQTIASGYEELHQEEQLNKLRIIREHLKLDGHERILDVGCGPCWSKEFFRNVVGIDTVQYNKDVITASAESIPFPDGTFDVILCVTAIHHFELDKALSEMLRVAKNDALFVITVLKKAGSFQAIRQRLKNAFCVVSTVDEKHDLVLFLVKDKAYVNHHLVSTK